MKKYNVDVNENGYVRCLIEESNGNLELDLSKYDLNHLSCYHYINGELVLDTEKLAELEAFKEKDKLLQEKAQLKTWLKEHDYIGTKIATGRATIEEYSDIIAEMNENAERINEIDKMYSK